MTINGDVSTDFLCDWQIRRKLADHGSIEAKRSM